MVLIITFCWLISTLVWYEPGQRYTSSTLLSSADYSVVSRDSLDDRRKWLVDLGGNATLALHSVWKGQHSKAKVSAQCNTLEGQTWDSQCGYGCNTSPSVHVDQGMNHCFQSECKRSAHSAPVRGCRNALQTVILRECDDPSSTSQENDLSSHVSAHFF